MPGFELFGEEERREVNEVLETGVLMRYGFDAVRKGKWKSLELEEALCGRLGSRHAHVCSSGTAAVFTALVGCGVGAGDEVIVPAFTFVADVEAILFAGATPVFAEIDDTLTLSVGGIEAALTSRTKAVLLVHMCGAMARVEDIRALCEKHGVLLIEDAAQALGASYRGKALGTFGKAGCYSFDYVKTVTCAEGGGIVTDDPSLFEVIQAFTDHGHDHKGVDRGADLHPVLGLNFRISELHAAVGLAQLRKLDTMLEIQRRHHRVLAEAVSSVEGVRLRVIPDPDGDSCTFLSFFMPDEELARKAARELVMEGIDGTFFWFDNNWHYVRRWDHFKALATPHRLAIANVDPLPEFTRPELPVSDHWMGRTISLLIKLGWTDEACASRAARLRDVLTRVIRSA